jgi:DNA-binding protein H-NS
MKRDELEHMPLEDLWALHVTISDTLAAKLVAEKKTLEERLSLLASKSPDAEARAVERKPYPTVFPKFQNPVEPFQTWAGRGKQPRWLMEQLKSGRRIDDFKIHQAAE